VKSSLPDPAATGTRRPRTRLAFAAAFVVGVVAVLGASVAALAAWDASYEGRILPGVRVGGVDLSGLDRAAAGRAVEAAFPYDQGRLVLRTPDGDMPVPFAAFGRRAETDALVEEAIRAGRDGSMAERAIGQVRQALSGTVIEPRMALDVAALSTAITRVVTTLDRTPVDATISIAAGGPVTTSASPGRTADPAPVVAAALAAASAMDAPAEIVLPVAVAAVPPVRPNVAVEIARARVQRLAQDVVVAWGKKKWTIPAATVLGWVRLEGGADGGITPVVQISGVEGNLAGAAKAVKKKAVSAAFLKTKGGKTFGVVPGKDGRALDVDVTTARITDELQARSDGNPATPVQVATMPVAPKMTTEQAAGSAPLMTKLGTWTTWFPISDHNFFGANIWRPAQIINGTVLKPGQRFEWWSAVGPVTAARGFGPGGVIRGSFTDPTGATGGGMCSSSTTLFNAALRAGLQINARSNHKYYINRYPIGLDATVSKMGGATQTMSFTNDTAHQLYIRGIRTRGGGRGYVTYEIWGVADGRTVSVGRPVVTTVRKATTSVVLVDTLRHGVRKQVEYPSNEMYVAVTRVVRNAVGKVIHNETFRTHYVLWNGRIEVGR